LAGFTLIEVMVGFSIFMLVMILLFSSFRQTSRTVQSGKEVSTQQTRQRGCLTQMSRYIASILKPAQGQAGMISCKEHEFYFVCATESGLVEARYVCDQAGGTLTQYTEQPADYSPDTYQVKRSCLDSLSECAFAYFNGTAWGPEWDPTQGLLPRMVKLKFRQENDVVQEMVVNIPVSE